MEVCGFIMLFLFFASISYLCMLILESSDKKNPFIGLFALLFLITVIAIDETTISTYKEFSKAMIKENNVTLNNVAPKYRATYITLKAEIEKENRIFQKNK